jgi:hypothetical protein
MVSSSGILYIIVNENDHHLPLSAQQENLKGAYIISLNPDGTLNKNFAGSGAVRIFEPAFHQVHVSSIAQSKEGNIVIAGTARHHDKIMNKADLAKSAMTRYQSGGSFSPPVYDQRFVKSFSSTGRQLQTSKIDTTYVHSEDIKALLPTSQGKFFYLVERIHPFEGFDVGRLTRSLEQDSTFRDGGRVSADPRLLKTLNVSSDIIFIDSLQLSEHGGCFASGTCIMLGERAADERKIISLFHIDDGGILTGLKSMEAAPFTFDPTMPEVVTLASPRGDSLLLAHYTTKGVLPKRFSFPDGMEDKTYAQNELPISDLFRTSGLSGDPSGTHRISGIGSNKAELLTAQLTEDGTVVSMNAFPLESVRAAARHCRDSFSKLSEH